MQRYTIVSVQAANLFDLAVAVSKWIKENGESWEPSGTPFQAQGGWNQAMFYRLGEVQ